MTTAWPVYTNANLFFDKKKKKKLANIQPSLQFYGRIFWRKKGSLQRNGMAAIPKIMMPGLQYWQRGRNNIGKKSSEGGPYF